MQILLLKLILTPILTGAATWAGRKYGHNVSGLLIGLPLNAGPVALFLALQHGDVFASESAKGIIFGAVSLGSYSATYASLSKRFNLIFCVAGGWTAYFASTFFLNQFDFSLLTTFLLTTFALAILLVCFPVYKPGVITVKPPHWDIPLRIVLATLFILGLTYISGNLGPRLSGLLTTFPIFGTIFATTTHYLYGSDACIRLLRGVVVSMFSFAVFFVVIAHYIQPLSVVVTFCLATIICLLVQVAILYAGRQIKRRRAAYTSQLQL